MRGFFQPKKIRIKHVFPPGETGVRSQEVVRDRSNRQVIIIQGVSRISDRC